MALSYTTRRSGASKTGPGRGDAAFEDPSAAAGALGVVGHAHDAHDVAEATEGDGEGDAVAPRARVSDVGDVPVGFGGAGARDAGGGGETPSKA